MNKFLKKFLNHYSLEQHLFIAIALGLLFRIFASFFVYTPMALDDLGHYWLPAIRMADGLPMNLPEYRAPLLPYILWIFIKTADVLGFGSDPINRIYSMNLGLGLFSLLGIVGAYYYCKGAIKQNNKYFSVLLYFFSIYAVMPYISTRAGGEFFCISFLMLGIGLLKYEKTFLGFFFIGIAVLFRYQLGIIYIFYGLYGFKRKTIINALVVGLILLTIESLVDLSYGRQMLGTLMAYIAENQKPYRSMTWYNFILFTLALCAFPLSCVMINKIKVVYSKHKEAVIAILIIIISHSLVPHKEERFIMPILPFLFIFMSSLWSESAEQKYSRIIFSPAFLIINTFFLILASFIPSQTGRIDPLLDANKKSKTAGFALINTDFSKWAYDVYLNKNVLQIDAKPRESLDLDKNINSIFVVAASNTSLIKSDGFTCEEPKFYSSPIDKVLFKLNPKLNSRKKTTTSMFCKKY